MLNVCDNWPFYKFFEFEDSDGLFLGDISDEFTFSLISETKRKEIVEVIFKQATSLLKLYKRSLL